MAARKASTKAELIKQMASEGGVSRAVASSMYNALSDAVAADLAKGGVAILPGIAKFSAKKTLARASYEGINRFTGKKQTFKPKAACTTVRARPLKALKQSIDHTVKGDCKSGVVRKGRK